VRPDVRGTGGRGLLPRCDHTIQNHADPRRTASVPSVEIFELYIRVVFGGNTPVITLNQRVGGSSPPRPTINCAELGRTPSGEQASCGDACVDPVAGWLLVRPSRRVTAERRRSGARCA